MFNMNFGQAIDALSEGKMVRRKEFKPDVFVFRQVPSTISSSLVPQMQSLPESVKSEFKQRLDRLPIYAIHYNNQLAIVKNNNRIEGWAPTAADTMATDWEIYGDQ